MLNKRKGSLQSYFVEIKNNIWVEEHPSKIQKPRHTKGQDISIYFPIISCKFTWLEKNFIFIHLEFVWTRKQSRCLSSTISISGGKLVGAAQVAVGVGVLVAIVNNAQVVPTAECRTIMVITVHGIMWVSVHCHLVWLVVRVIQRKQKCLIAVYPTAAWKK